MQVPTDPIAEFLDRYCEYEISGRETEGGNSISGWQCIVTNWHPAALSATLLF
jgi:hypothetical protein